MHADPAEYAFRVVIVRAQKEKHKHLCGLLMLASAKWELIRFQMKTALNKKKCTLSLYYIGTKCLDKQEHPHGRSLRFAVDSLFFSSSCFRKALKKQLIIR